MVIMQYRHWLELTVLVGYIIYQGVNLILMSWVATIQWEGNCTYEMVNITHSFGLT